MTTSEGHDCEREIASLINIFPIVLIFVFLIIAFKVAGIKNARTQNRSGIIINSLKLCSNFALSGFFVYVFCERYYKWIDCYNEIGRCYDPDSHEVYTEAGMFWIVPALIFFFFGMKLILKFTKNFR